MAAFPACYGNGMLAMTIVRFGLVKLLYAAIDGTNKMTW